MDIEAETTIINEFVSKGNYHAAMNIAISAMNECRRDNQQAGVNHFLNVIKNIADSMTQEFSA